MDILLKLNRLNKKLQQEKSKRIKAEALNKSLRYEISVLKQTYLDKEPVDISSTISAIHELRKMHRSIDIYHVAMISYASSVGKFTSNQFRNRFSSGKNKFYEVMLNMRSWGYIESVDISYKRRRTYFYLTAKGIALSEKIGQLVIAAKKQGKKRRMSNGQEK